MINAKFSEVRCCEECKHEPSRPCPDLIACLTSGPLCHESAECKEMRSRSVKSLRREVLKKPAIFIGTGTCGMGAGAGGTLAAIKSYLAEKKIDAEVVEVGCIGLCAAEPMVDIQVPGRSRLSFGGITEDKAAELLDAVMAEKVPEELVTGQFRPSEDSEQQVWDSVPYLDEHPFFKPQTRWVLANCGIMDPKHRRVYCSRRLPCLRQNPARHHPAGGLRSGGR